MIDIIPQKFLHASWDFYYENSERSSGYGFLIDEKLKVMGKNISCFECHKKLVGGQSRYFYYFKNEFEFFFCLEHVPEYLLNYFNKLKMLYCLSK